MASRVDVKPGIARVAVIQEDFLGIKKERRSLDSLSFLRSLASKENYIKAKQYCFKSPESQCIGVVGR